MHSGLVLVNPKNGQKCKIDDLQTDRQKVIGLAPVSAL
jgi:hypothetical protein